MTSDHDLGYRAMDFNDGSRIILDETHLFRRGMLVNPRGWGKTAEQARKLAEQMGAAMGDAAKAMQLIVDSLPTVPTVQFARERLNTWSLAADPGEEYDDADPMARALALRRTRNTGPARPSAASARRPRRHQ